MFSLPVQHWRQKVRWSATITKTNSTANLLKNSNNIKLTCLSSFCHHNQSHQRLERQSNEGPHECKNLTCFLYQYDRLQNAQHLWQKQRQRWQSVETLQVIFTSTTPTGDKEFFNAGNKMTWWQSDNGNKSDSSAEVYIVSLPVRHQWQKVQHIQHSQSREFYL